MSNIRLCPSCLRWHHAADYCEPESMVKRWGSIEPRLQDRADRAEERLIRAYQGIRRR